MVDEGGKELFTDYVKEKTLNEPEEMTFYLTFYVKARKKERIRSMYNKTIIRFGFCDIQNNQGLYLDLDYSGYHKNLIQ